MASCSGVVGVERVGVVGGGLWVRCWVLRERAVACCLSGRLGGYRLGLFLGWPAVVAGVGFVV